MLEKFRKVTQLLADYAQLFCVRKIQYATPYFKRLNRVISNLQRPGKYLATNANEQMFLLNKKKIVSPCIFLWFSSRDPFGTWYSSLHLFSVFQELFCVRFHEENQRYTYFHFTLVHHHSTILFALVCVILYVAKQNM